MSNGNPTNPRRSNSPPQSIPLQDLSRPPDNSPEVGDIEVPEERHTRGRSLLGGGPVSPPGPRYSRLDDSSPSPKLRVLLPAGPTSGRYQAPSIEVQDEDDITNRSGSRPGTSGSGGPGGRNTDAFHAAAIGLSMPPLMTPAIQTPGFAHIPRAGSRETARGSPAPRNLLLSVRRESYDDEVSPYTDPYGDLDDGGYFGQNRDAPSIAEEDDGVGLTDQRYLAPISGSIAGSSGRPQTPRTSSDTHGRLSFQSVHFGSPNSASRGSGMGGGGMLGDDLPHTPDRGRGRSQSFGRSLSPESHRISRSISGGGRNASRLVRAGSVMRAMSQRVANIGNDDELPEPVPFGRNRKDSVVSGSGLSQVHTTEGMGLPPILLNDEEIANPFGEGASRIDRKQSEASVEEEQRMESTTNAPTWPENNPLRGKSLGIFAQDNLLRMRLCEVLLHWATEPFILALIVLQTILLAVESSSDVYTNPTPNTWTGSNIDFAMFALFILYTIELAAKVVVSGFFFNAEGYSTRSDPKQGIQDTIMAKYRRYFGPPRRQQSFKVARHLEPTTISTAFTRSYTTAFKASTPNYKPQTIKEQQRYQLARRAFFRHSLNRIDFVAVFAYWISFVLGITGIEAEKHLYLFKMLSCLRILRLLWITQGTAIILKSLKKAAPLLVNVSFLIGFFWLLFAIVGIQAFKSSFSRSCVWIDPTGQANFDNGEQLCGGYLDVETGKALPWVFADGTAGAKRPKGYLCPRGSQCVEGESLYNGTVSFDNIFNSLELVFVIMSANTFTDLMYYTMDSDYLASALFFAAGIVIMLLWLTNLLIAVITSSFQVIREESKKSAFTGEVKEGPAKLEQSQPSQRATTLKKAYNYTFWLWIVVITFGLIVQACRSAKMSRHRENFLFVTEVFVTLTLDLEITFRLVSDHRNFHRSWKNWFDLFLVVVTTVILIPPIRNSGTPYAWLTIFQIVRIYRVVWAIPMTRNLIALVLGNASGILNLVLFVFLITFLVAILAVQMFRGDIPPYDDNGETVRTTFYSIWNSFLGMYQILSSEDWTDILYDVTSYNTHLNTGWMGAAFFIAWFILAYFILVNMFIAVIQENFDVSEDEKRLKQVEAFLAQRDMGGTSSNLSLSAIFRFGRSKKIKDPLDYGSSTMEMLLKDAVVKDFLDDESAEAPAIPQLRTSHTFDMAPEVSAGMISHWWGQFVTRVWHREPNPFYSTPETSHEARDPRTMAKEAVSATAMRKRAQREYLSRHPNYNKAMFIFHPDNKIRRFCQKIVGPGRGSERIEGVEPNKIVWYSFSAFIYAAIVTMVVLACVTTPLYQKQYFETHDFQFRNWFVWTDLAFAVLFTTEAIIKMIADGCFWTPNAYFRSLWGSIDGVVLVTLWINVITSFLNDGSISRAVGAFKALRALRLLHISDSARDTFHSVVLVGGGRVLSAAFVSMSLLVPFAIYALNLFNGQFVVCNDGGSGIVKLADCTGEYMATPFSNDWVFPAPRVASNPFYDFDNFGSALFILFQIVSQEGWADVMWSAESIMGRGLQPQDFASQGNAVFFVVFNLMATVFVLTLFISVFMRTYTEQTGVAFLTAEQRSWMELRKLLRQVNPSKRPSTKDKGKWVDWCYRKAVQKHGHWPRTITTTLVLHLFLLMIEFYPEPYWWVRLRDAIFLLFTLIYSAHIGVRIVGLNWSRFRRSSWDLYSLVSVIGTIVTTLLLFSNYSSVTYSQLHKLFLVSITLLLIPRNNALDQLFKTAAASLNSILNLLATWLILFLVYAIAMTQTFGLTRFGGQGTNNLNFRDVPRALIMLFRMSVGEGWNEIMEDYANIRPPLCVDGPTFFDSDCGSRNWARALFISWNILSMYIFVSLFVSLIYESFSYVYQRSSGHEIVNRDETRRFKQAWATFDPEGTGYINKENFPRLLGELSGVFAMRIYKEENSVHRILDDVRASLGPGNRHSSIATFSDPYDIDLQRLNARIAKIDAMAVRERRHKYNIFYEEVMVSADPDRGVSFTSVLMILAHYKIISDNKSLKLDEFLRRRARLQRVEEEVHRRVVVGFFDTMYWSRRFRRHLARHTASRINNLDDFSVPAIVVDDPFGHESDVTAGLHSGSEDEDGRSPGGTGGKGPENGKDAMYGRKMSSTIDFGAEHRSSAREMFGLGHDGAFGAFASHSRNSSRDSNMTAPSSPISSRQSRRDSTRRSGGDTVRRGSVGEGPSGLGARLRMHRTASSVSGPEDLSEILPPRTGLGPGDGPEGERSGSRSRPVSALGDVAMETFNDSVWGESLRKSFTIRRPEREGDGQ